MVLVSVMLILSYFRLEDTVLPASNLSITVFLVLEMDLLLLFVRIVLWGLTWILLPIIVAFFARKIVTHVMLLAA